MDTHRLAALELSRMLSDRNFKMIRKKPYVSRRFGWPGVRWEGELNGRPIYGSENRTTVPTPPSELAKTLMGYECCIDQSKSVLYFAPRRPGSGLRIEFHDREGRWYEVWTPDL
jgi:hypothetical protein